MSGSELAQVTWLDRLRVNTRLRTLVGAALPVGWVTVLLLLPYLFLFAHSFFRLKGGQLTHELTLENYGRLFGTALYPQTILFSAGIAIRVTLCSLLLAYPLAYLLAFKVTRHRNLLYMAVIIPLWVSYLVRAYAWKIILGQEGILNGFLLSIGVIHEPLTVLLYSKWAVMLALVHIYTPFTLMPIYAVLEAIPPAYKEASQDLYASRWATFRNVVLPLSLPGVVAGCTFAFVLSMGDFIAPQLLGGNDSALMVSNLVVSLFGVAFNWPLGAAISVVMLCMTMVLLTIARGIEDRMNYGGQAAGRSGGQGSTVGRGSLHT
ncbi:MAG: ABC transporter permease [Gemmatimonadales bacterium]|mgnify:CR=1 FL=1